jgi:hypothetical protein
LQYSWSVRRWLRLLLAGATLSTAFTTHAQSSKTKQLAGTLRKDPDHRVRIDAALKLGTSDDADAVAPLCGCLSDTSETELVRVACAAALGKLNKPGRNECLTKNANDTSAKVKAQVAAAQKTAGPVSTTTSAPQIVCSGAPGPGVAKYYVGVVVTNKTKRPDAELVPALRQEFGCKLRSYGRFKLATDTDAKAIGAVVAKEKLQGYLLTLTVEPTKVDGKTVRVAMKLLVTTHTGDLKGELGKQLAIAGAPTTALEDELLRTGAASLADDFAASKP